MLNRILSRRRATLAECSACGTDFVHPVEWAPHDAESWWMLLRCGQCGDRWEETVSDEAAEQFDRELESAEYGMRRLAERLDREALEQQADALATAFELDLIGADDFGR